MKNGWEKVRQVLGALGLNPAPVKTSRKPAPDVSTAPEYPAGRRVQIDATQVAVAVGKVWVYLV